MKPSERAADLASKLTFLLLYGGSISILLFFLFGFLVAALSR